ncbi:glycosyl hydrolase family 28-related protein [Vibrio parahaemolyticus]|uniref:glycosyl hydrolase family 28-related protein n=1 Tax=Vibrio parahaemolyticus TaxID=670 RepID=UPI00235E17E6|nr:glycosyl hydrolase family 28-related protein [Vibrio parahaemolyticus]
MANTTDKSILTAAGKALLAQLNAEEKPLIIDKMIFANVPNRPEFPQPDDVVPTDDIVHQEQVEQRGRLSADSVIYSTTLTSDVGPFEFNWTGTYCSEYGVLVTIDHHALTPKTADEPGVAGNTLVRSVVLEYKDIAEITNITVDASSWQYNATDRMKKMDSDVAQSIIDQNGKDWFIEDGFLVTPSGSAYNIKAGAGYASGNRVSMEFDRSVQVPNKPSFIYIDAHREGTSTGEQVTLFDLVITAEEKDDYIDSSTGKDIPHFVCKIAEVLADGSVSDLRPEAEWLHWSKNNISNKVGFQSRFGITSRSLYDRFGDKVNVKDFGAKGDGISDDTNAIQAALDMGTEVFFPKGVYLTSRPLIQRSGVVIKGTGRSLGSSDGAATIKKINNSRYGLIDAIIVGGDELCRNVVYSRIDNIILDSIGSEFGYWCGIRDGYNVSNSTFQNLTIRNCNNHIWIDHCWLMDYRKVNLGGGNNGFYIGYNNSTSNHFYECYTNLTKVGFFVNSVYSSINGCAADYAEIGYVIGSGVSINDCGCEFPAVAIQAYYARQPVKVNRLKVICKDEGTTIVHNYREDVQGSVVFDGCDFSATEEAKSNLKIVNGKGSKGEDRFIQFVDSYVSTYIEAQDKTYLTPLWEFPNSIVEGFEYLSILYGLNKKQKFIDEALSLNSKRYLLTKLSPNSKYNIDYSSESVAAIHCITKDNSVFILKEDYFELSQKLNFFIKENEDGIYLQYEEDGNNSVTFRQTIEGDVVERVYPLQVVESPQKFTKISPNYTV